MVIVMLAALATQMPAGEAPKSCPSSRAAELVDGRYDAAARKRASAIAGKSPVRWILPGSAVTQDYVPERLNVEVGDDGVVHRVWCG